MTESIYFLMDEKTERLLKSRMLGKGKVFCIGTGYKPAKPQDFPKPYSENGWVKAYLHSDEYGKMEYKTENGHIADVKSPVIEYVPFRINSQTKTITCGTLCVKTGEDEQNNAIVSDFNLLVKWVEEKLEVLPCVKTKGNSTVLASNTLKPLLLQGYVVCD